MDKKILEKLINASLTTGADFSGIFYEYTTRKRYLLEDSRIDKIKTKIISGIGFRLAKDKEVVYSSTNNLDYDHLLETVNNLKQSFNGKQVIKKVVLKDKYIKEENLDFNNNYTLKDKKNLLLKIDKIARDHSNKVEQVKAMLLEDKQYVEIANQKGEFSTDTRHLFRLVIQIYVKDKDKRDYTYEAFGNSSGYNFFNDFNLEEKVKDLVDIALSKLDAVPCPSGDMPVIIGPAFGAVIIHEACGHALEATSVARDTSVLNDKKGELVANPKVTIIDDGTIEEAWGSTYIDDEGNKTKKNILIENGVLKNYLYDELSTRLKPDKITSSARREDYTFPPTSRMNNTYVAKGTDKINDMIKSISYGLYAKTMNGGSVDTYTGDFNFGVREAYLIENGEVTKMVKGASLIGNTKDILKRIDMVSDDLELGTGYCGSASGSVAVTCGQPTIRVSKILVGGEKND